VKTILRLSASAAILGFLLWPSAARAQAAAQPFRVQLHVSGDEAIKTQALAQLTRTLQRVRDIELTARDGEYVLSLVIVRTTTGGYAASAAIMTVYTARSLGDIASRLGASPASRDQLIAQFTGAGALLDQRVLTSADLNTLCDDAAGALNADVLGRERRFRATP
jgi:hypothetical protein